MAKNLPPEGKTTMQNTDNFKKKLAQLERKLENFEAGAKEKEKLESQLKKAKKENIHLKKVTEIERKTRERLAADYNNLEKRLEKEQEIRQHQKTGSLLELILLLFITFQIVPELYDEILGIVTLPKRNGPLEQLFARMLGKKHDAHR